MGTRDHRTYDHRLRKLGWRTQSTSVVSQLAIPRSTLDDWLRIAPTPVITLYAFDADAGELRAELARLRSRVAKLLALLRLLAALISVSDIRVSMRRLPERKDKKPVLRAVDRSRGTLSIVAALRAIGISTARFHAWRHARENCTLEDRSSCSRFSPHRITLEEKQAIRSAVMGENYRHVPTRTLAMLAQRSGRAYVSASTWLRLIRENGWRRPRVRVHSAKPRAGIRAERPDQLWHVDTTVIRLLDGTRVYVHAVIDIFSRRILAWRATARFEVASTAIVRNEAAAAGSEEAATPKLLTDAGIENLNDGVDALIVSGLIQRVLAQTDVTFRINRPCCRDSATRRAPLLCPTSRHHREEPAG